MTAIEIPAQPDLLRLRRDRGRRLRSAMRNQGIDALVLLGNSNVIYATGAAWPLSDAGLANVERPVTVVLAEDESPHLFTPYRDDAAAEVDLDEDHLHGPVYLDFDEGVEAFAKVLAGLAPKTAAVAVDELTAAMHRRHDLLFADWPPRPAADVVGQARLVKTPDELACIRRSLWITEQAMYDVQAHLVPGIRQTDLTARFLRRIFELGADANILDPIWQVMPDKRADLPWTVHGDIPCPLLTTERRLADGDVVWVDTGIMCGGYHSDFGRTWVVGTKPNARQQDQYHRWQEINQAVVDVMRAGATGAELTSAAMAVCGGNRPWMPHFYIGHGLGLDSAEMPFVGTDLGDDFDAGLVLAEGMILVVEPIVWDEGYSGYRSENVFVITEDGCTNLSDYPYDPYAD
jgi:Xaa-Pro dipeptidase